MWCHSTGRFPYHQSTISSWLYHLTGIRIHPNESCTPRQLLKRDEEKKYQHLSINDDTLAGQNLVADVDDLNWGWIFLCIKRIHLVWIRRFIGRPIVVFHQPGKLWTKGKLTVVHWTIHPWYSCKASQKVFPGATRCLRRDHPQGIANPCTLSFWVWSLKEIINASWGLWQFAKNSPPESWIMFLFLEKTIGKWWNPMKYRRMCIYIIRIYSHSLLWYTVYITIVCHRPFQIILSLFNDPKQGIHRTHWNQTTEAIDVFKKPRNVEDAWSDGSEGQF